MNNESLPGNELGAAKDSATRNDAEIPQRAAAAPTTSERDALAGAFPNWDLVPSSPFVRRIK